jgi:hypothetical protein
LGIASCRVCWKGSEGAREQGSKGAREQGRKGGREEVRGGGLLLEISKKCRKRGFGEKVQLLR